MNMFSNPLRILGGTSQRTLRECEKRLQACEKTLEGVMSAAKPLDPKDVNPLQMIRRIQNKYYIRKGPGDDWSGDGIRFHEIHAGEAPVQFYRTQIVASKHASPIKYLDGLDFVANDESNREILYLPLELEDRRKRLLLVLTPPINPGESRSVTTTWNWVGMWNQLKIDGRDEMTWQYFSKEPCALFEIEVFWDPDLQCELDLKLVEGPLEFEGPVPIRDSRRRWRGCKCVLTNLPNGTTITATLSRRQARRWQSSAGLLDVAQHERSWGDVIFVHGLNGDPVTTWHPANRPDLFWPEQLAFDFPLINIWSLGYAAQAFGWGGKTKKTMSLEERATNVLASIEANGIGKKPIIFVCHSYGGLLVKQVLRNAMDGNNQSWRSIAKSAKGIFFLATPHHGSDLASFLKNLAILLQTSNIVEELGANEPALTSLNRWYRENASMLGISTAVLFEKLPTGPRLGKVLVVGEATSDPGISGLIPIPVDEDHISICKPKSLDALQVERLRQFIDDVSRMQSVLKDGGSTGKV